MTTNNQQAPEAKMNDIGSAAAQGLGGNPELAAAFDDFIHSFEQFKDANDDRLSQIERRTSADVITEEKVNRIDRAVDENKRHLDQLILKHRRPSLDGNPAFSPHQLEHKSGFDAYLRSGEEQGLRQIEQKSFSTGSDPDGGFLVPEELSSEIGRRLAAISPIRALSTVRQISSSTYKKPFATSGAETGWVGETDNRPETSTPTLAELQFQAMEIYAMPAATPALLEDSAVDLDSWIAEEVETVFAAQEGTAFVTGDGINKPRGFLNTPTVDEESWTWGNLGYVTTGTDSGFALSQGGDVMIETIYSLKAGYRQNAHFILNRKTQAELRKLKDGDGNYLWQAPATIGSNASLMGFPVVECEDMPDISSGATAIAFGDFRRGYLVVDRTGIRVLRDPYSMKPYILFYITKRVGGGVQDFDAIKLIKFS